MTSTIAGRSPLSVFMCTPRKLAWGLSSGSLAQVTERVNRLGDYLSSWLQAAIPVVVGSGMVVSVTLIVQWTQQRDQIEVFKERVSTLTSTVNDRFNTVSADMNSKITDVISINNERVALISARLSGQETILRELAVTQARMQEQKMAVDFQISHQAKKMDEVLQAISDGKVQSATISTTVGNILSLLQNGEQLKQHR